MSDSVFIGQRAASLETSPAFEAVTKVILLVDENNYYEAGADGGRTLEVTCPYATQAMANNILASLSGYQYQPAQATDAMMDPAAELGDAITVGGIYTVLASADITFDELMTSDVGAPGQEEIESEYPYQSKQTSAIQRQIAQNASLIAKTAEEIRLEIQNISGEVTALQVTIDGVTVTDSSGTTLIKGSSIETDTLYVNAANITGTLTAAQIDATNLKVSAANITGTLTIGQLPSNVATESDIPTYTSQLINNSGYQTASGVTTIINGTVTTDYVNALGVYAATLKGNQIQLLQGSGAVSGVISLSAATSANYAVDITSNAALRLTANSGNIYLTNNWSSLGLNASNDLRGIISQNVMPSGNDEWYVGDYNRRYSGVYVTSGLITSSDRNLKKNIQPMPEKYLSMLYDLEPSIFQMVNGTSGRYHTGFIAQDVESAMSANNISATEFAGLVIGGMDSDNPVYMLRYDKFIPIAVKAIQDLNTRVKELEANR